MDYTNEVFAVIAEEISKCKDGIITSHCYSGVNKLINVDDVPTAYDIDKVVR